MGKKKIDSEDEEDFFDDELDDGGDDTPFSDEFSESEKKKPPKKKAKELKENKENTKPTNNKSNSKTTISTAASSAPSYNSDGTIDITKGPPVVTDSSAKKLIMQYFIQQNRPYSLLQIFENLHKRITKGTLEKCLTSLSSPGQGLSCKEYGKSKIYYPDQSLLNSDFTQDMLDNLIDENEALRVEHSELGKNEKSLKNQISSLNSEPTDSDLVKLLSELKESIEKKTKKIESLTSNVDLSKGSSTIDDKIREFNKNRLTWIARKSMCMDVVEMMSEGLGKKTTELTSMMCIETDKDMNVALPPARQLPKKV